MRKTTACLLCSNLVFCTEDMSNNCCRNRKNWARIENFHATNKKLSDSIKARLRNPTVEVIKKQYDIRKIGAMTIANRKNKKSKERKNWENNNMIWQGKKRYI